MLSLRIFLRRVIKFTSIIYYFLRRKFVTKPNIEATIEKYIDRSSVNSDLDILYIGVKYDYNEFSRGLSFEEYNVYRSLIRDYNIIRYDFYTVAKLYGPEFANKILKEIILIYQVKQLFVILYTDIFDKKILQNLKDQINIKTTLYLFDDDKRYQETKELTKHFNTVITSIPEKHSIRVNSGFDSVLLPFGVNDALYRPLNVVRDLDVVFIGQKFGNREKCISSLRAKGIHVVTAGRNWPEGRITQGEMIELINRAKIVLNFSGSAGNEHLKHINGRIFEVLATSSFLIAEYSSDLVNYFDIEKDLVTFTDEKQLISLVSYYLHNEEEREKISHSGYNTVKSKYSINKLLAPILKN